MPPPAEGRDRRRLRLTPAPRPPPHSAACYTYEITVTGVGAHGALPHESKDAVAATGAIISGIHQIVARTVDPTDSAVVSIGYVHGGQAFNVIPETMELGGTIRLLSKAKFEEFFATLTTRVQGIAEAYGCTAEVRNRDGLKQLNARGAEVRPPADRAAPRSPAGRGG